MGMIPETNKQNNATFSSCKSLIIIFATTLLVRIGVMVILRSWEFPNEWRFGYEMGLLGRGLAEGKGFVLRDLSSPSAAFPPVYPLMVWGVFAVFGVYSKAAAIVLLLFQSVCSAVSAVCLAVLGNRLLQRPAGLVAGFVWALYPSSIYRSVIKIWYSELAVMLLLIALTVAVTAMYPATFRLLSFLGALSGLIVLTDPTMALYLPLLVLWMLFARGIEISRLVALVVAWGIVAAVVVSPWAIRNWYVMGSPRIVKSNFGGALFYGNNSFASGAPTEAEVDQAFASLDQEELSYFSWNPITRKGQPELAYNRYLRNEALEWMRANPFKFLHLTAKRIWYFWVRIPKKKSWLHVALFGPFAVLALYGLLYGLRRRWHLAPVWLFTLVYPLPYYVTHIPVYRYRYPVEPFVVLLAAIPLAIWIVPVLSRVYSKQPLFYLHPPSYPRTPEVAVADRVQGKGQNIL
jgi:4-amino-4-deoxy-L-arabinose transferase-like glycosyltransferase